ncbi:MAG TPA: PadR family transcriptional regulator [Candidatus Dormibacteraeota bacterium]|jgi:DNA-binding PadR family transcriptional regulator
METRTRPKDMIGLATLALISEQPRHPYEIQRLLRGRHKTYAVGKTRELYRAIEELDAAGLIEQLETSREGRRPERTVYRITGDGREHLENWLAELLETPVHRDLVFNVAMGLIAYLDQERAQAALRTRTVNLRAALVGLDESHRLLQEQLHLPRLVLLELEHSMALANAELEWVGSLLHDMESGTLAWNEEIIAAHFAAMHAAEEAQHAHITSHQTQTSTGEHSR